MNKAEQHAAINDTPCELEVDTDWPYDCIAKDENPDHRVTVCKSHHVWWHEPREEHNA